MEKSVYKTTDTELKELRSKQYLEFESAVVEIHNPILLILQCHLYIENLLERFIIAELPNGKSLIDKGNLTFFQKIMVVNSFGIVDLQVIDALKKYNSLRNDLAHKYGHTIEKQQIESIGRTLGKIYSDIEVKAQTCLVREIHLITAYITGCIGSYTHIAESRKKSNS